MVNLQRYFPSSAANLMLSAIWLIFTILLGSWFQSLTKLNTLLFLLYLQLFHMLCFPISEQSFKGLIIDTLNQQLAVHSQHSYSCAHCTITPETLRNVSFFNQIFLATYFQRGLGPFHLCQVIFFTIQYVCISSEFFFLQYFIP